MAPLTLQAYLTRVAPQLNDLVWEHLRNYMTSYQFEWIPRLFNLAPTNRLTHEFSVQESIGPWQPGTELSPYPVDEWDLPTDQQFTLQRYKNSFILSEDLLRYGTPELHVFPKLQDRLRDFALGAMKAYDRSAGTLLLDMFSGAIQTCPDGLPLISNTHTKGTNPTVYDNLLPWQLSNAALDAAFALNTAEDMQDASGHPLSTNFDTLVVGPRNKRLAFELISNTVLPGATNAEKNYYGGVVKNVYECPWFKASLGTQDWWMLIDSSSHWLRGLVAESPNVRLNPAAPGPDQIQFLGRTIYRFFYNDWQGVIASNGSAAIT